jgi:Putative Ig domain
MPWKGPSVPVIDLSEPADPRRRARRVLIPALGAAALIAAILTVPATAAGAAGAPTVVTAAVPANVAAACPTDSAPGVMHCLALRRTDLVTPNAIAPNATPSGLGPSDLRSAYALPATGTTATVAIVDAYDDPNAESDLATYRTQYGLPACTSANGCFKKVNQSGSTGSLPTADTGWAGEISLDLDMVSAVCSSCDILLVEANSANDADLFAAINEAVALGAKFVSNSWGGAEASSQTSYDASALNHPGVAITVSSGDSGYGAEFPATSKYVTAVGGTSLTRASGTARGWTESAWSGAGSGCSAYEAKPTWQTVTTGCSRRAEADVSAVADPNTGLAVYQTYGASGWSVYGGTSASAPIVAAVYALAGTPGASDYPASYPYASSGSLNDVTSGNNGSCGSPMCTTTTGWDGPTGLGTPSGTAAFTAASTGGSVSVTNPGSQSTAVGASTSLTLAASGGTGSYTWSATGLPAGLVIGGSTGVISGTPTTAGTYSVTATATSGGVSGATTFTWTVTASGSGGCTAAQLLGNPGFETGSASPWSASSGVVSAASGGEAPRSGSYFAWLDGYGSTHTDTLSQSVSIPSSCATATLSFWLKIDTAETTTSTAYDKLTVTVGSTTLATYSNLNQGAYAQKSFSLAAYVGQTVTVTFTGTEDSSLQTSFVIDDTAVTVG